MLLETPKQFRAVDVHIVEPGRRGHGVTSSDRVSSAAAPETTVPDPVLTAERAHLARAADCLTEMRAAASAVTDAGVDAWASERLGAARAERLRRWPPIPASRPSSAAPTRAEPRPSTSAAGTSATRAGDPVVIDWRAPMSRPFYQASAADPQGLVRRRRFGFAGGELTGYEDELLGRRGRARQRACCGRRSSGPRSGPMRDIVATIQPDQDDIVRAPLAESICVQGAPGTGKTAVGLHRAAYLLYTHAGQLARSGVLVVGPNRAFLRYIEQVLPTLGEVDVDQTTVAGADRRGCRCARSTRPEVAVLKGDARMAEVLRRALWGEIAKPADSIQVPLAGRRYRVPVERLKRYVDDVRRRGAHRGRPAAAALRGRPGAAGDAARRGRPPAEGGGRRQPHRRRDPRARPAAPRCGRSATRCGRPATPPALVCTTCSPTRRGWPAPPGASSTTTSRRCCAGPRRRARCAPRRWTDADAVLVDEAAGLLERTAGYGHVVLDEAQDLSPMQCRAVARRLRRRLADRARRPRPGDQPVVAVGLAGRRWPAWAGRTPSSAR